MALERLCQNGVRYRNVNDVLANCLSSPRCEAHLVKDGEEEVFDIRLDCLTRELTADEKLSVEDDDVRVHLEFIMTWFLAAC